jgi:hypothetical protein
LTGPQMESLFSSIEVRSDRRLRKASGRMVSRPWEAVDAIATFLVSAKDEAAYRSERTEPIQQMTLPLFRTGDPGVDQRDCPRWFARSFRFPGLPVSTISEWLASMRTYPSPRKFCGVSDTEIIPAQARCSIVLQPPSPVVEFADRLVTQPAMLNQLRCRGASIKRLTN